VLKIERFKREKRGELVCCDTQEKKKKKEQIIYNLFVFLSKKDAATQFYNIIYVESLTIL